MVVLNRILNNLQFYLVSGLAVPVSILSDYGAVFFAGLMGIWEEVSGLQRGGLSSLQRGGLSGLQRGGLSSLQRGGLSGLRTFVFRRSVQCSIYQQYHMRPAGRESGMLSGGGGMRLALKKGCAFVPAVANLMAKLGRIIDWVRLPVGLVPVGVYGKKKCVFVGVGDEMRLVLRGTFKRAWGLNEFKKSLSILGGGFNERISNPYKRHRDVAMLHIEQGILNYEVKTPKRAWGLNEFLLDENGGGVGFVSEGVLP